MEFSIPGETRGLLYASSPRGDQTVAVVEMEGRYPEQGYSLNDVSTETLLVLEGSVMAEAGEERHELSEGDLFMVFPQTKYRLEGKARVAVFITPAWEKNKNVTGV